MQLLLQPVTHKKDGKCICIHAKYSRSDSDLMVPIQVWLSPTFVSHTLGHRERGDWILEGQGRWGGMRSTERPFSLLTSILKFRLLIVNYSAAHRQWHPLAADGLRLASLVMFMVNVHWYIGTHCPLIGSLLHLVHCPHWWTMDSVSMYQTNPSMRMIVQRLCNILWLSGPRSADAYLRL